MNEQNVINTFRYWMKKTEFHFNIPSVKFYLICFIFLAILLSMLGLSSPTRDWTHDPLHWKHGALTTEPPGKSLARAFKHNVVSAGSGGWKNEGVRKGNQRERKEKEVGNEQKGGRWEERRKEEETKSSYSFKQFRVKSAPIYVFVIWLFLTFPLLNYYLFFYLN